MTLNHLIGKTARHSLEWLVRRPLIGRLPIPKGICWPFDVNRLLQTPVRQVIDAGANIGQTALYVKDFFVTAQIHSFEPSATTFEQLRRRTIGQTGIRCCQAALGEAIRPARLALHSDSELNCIAESKVSSSNSSKFEDIEMITLDSYCESNSIKFVDVLKMDVQGYELRLIEGARRMMAERRIGFVYSEVSFSQGQQEMQYFEPLNQRLQLEGFVLSGFYDFFRWGSGKGYLGFCNALYINPDYSPTRPQ